MNLAHIPGETSACVCHRREVQLNLKPTGCTARSTVVDFVYFCEKVRDHISDRISLLGHELTVACADAHASANRSGVEFEL